MARVLGGMLLALVSGAAQAQGAFGGIEIGAMRHSFDSDRVLADGVKSDSATVFGLKGGYMGTGARYYAAAHLPRTENDDHTAYWLTLGADYLLPTGTGTVTPFAGGTVGHYGYEIEDRYGSRDYQLNAYTVGLEAGVLFPLFKDQAEVTYRYAVGLGSSDNGRGFDAELRRVVTVTFAVNFGGGGDGGGGGTGAAGGGVGGP